MYATTPVGRRARLPDVRMASGSGSGQGRSADITMIDCRAWLTQTTPRAFSTSCWLGRALRRGAR